MNSTTRIRISCPKCGKIDGEYNINEYRYGSPIRKCKKCGNKFVNKFYHEIAVDGAAPGAFDVMQKVKAMLVVLGLFLICVIIHAIEIFYRDSYHILFPLMAVICIFSFLFFVGDIIAIKSGLKQKRTDKQYAESIERLKNTEYARELESCGYNVPPEFLGEEETTV